MADSKNSGRFLFLNPWIHHLQKLCLELKCSLCLNLLNRPLLMPCDHIFCSSCISRSTGFGSECPACRSPFYDEDLRMAPHMENMVNIYKSMDAAFGANLLHWVPQSQIDAAMGTSGDPQSFPVSLRADEGPKVPSQFSEVKVKNSRIPDESHVPCNGGAQKNLEQPIGERRVLQEKRNGVSLQGQQLRDERDTVGGVPEGYLNLFMQTSLDSPLSFGDGKDSDDDSSYHCSQQSVEKFSAKSMMNKETVDGFVTEMGRGQSTQPGEDHGSENVVMSKSKPENCSSATVQPLVGPDDSDSKSTVTCAFCHSSSLSQYTGPMIHFANGKEVVADKVAQRNVLHVHRRCVEWTPRVYFVDDTVYNLEKEISRGAKLKCNHCGLKGAALGCCVKYCRKSFHVPCAVQIEDCRWDIENFHMLCPTHSSVKFSNEISKLGKRKRACHASENQIESSQHIKSGETLAGNPQGWVLCGSSLSIMEQNTLAEFAKLTGATISKLWQPKVTHVIAATDDMGACSRTIKVLMAILHGRWVLKIDWIKSCLEASQLLSEEPYEVRHDIYGCCDGPKNGRLRILEKAPRLLTGLTFYFFGDFVSSYKERLEDLVLAAGGNLLTDEAMLLPEDSKHTTPSTFIVYNRELLENCTSVEESMECRVKEAKDFAAEFGCRVIGHTWILESIAACKIQPSF